MEKIYEEQNSSQKRQKMNFSIILSFAVAVFAILSLIVVGFNQISYAAPSEETYAEGSEGPETIEPGYEKDGSDKELFIRATGVWLDGSSPDSGVFELPILYDTSVNKSAKEFVDYYLFCVQQGRAVAADTENDRIDNAADVAFSSDGVAYILSNSSVLGGNGIAILKGNLNNDNKYIEYFATQIAIWLYLDAEGAGGDYKGHLHEAQVDGSTARSYTPFQVIHGGETAEGFAAGDSYISTLEMVNELGQVSGTIFEADTSNTHALNSAINKVVNAALDNPTINSISVNPGVQDVSLVEDGKVYQTSAISVNATGNLQSYAVYLSGIDGAYVVDKDGQKRIEFTPGESFYVRVPVDKVTEKNKQVFIELSGDFIGRAGSYYGVTSSQALTKIVSTQPRVRDYYTLNFMESPNTGMTTAQTIYFIGLIVLLCGVGIIYANAKPVEEK